LGLPQPIAIRYPRGRGITLDWQQPFQKIEIGKAELLKNGTKIAVLTTGTMAQNATEAIALSENSNTMAHYDFKFIKPLDEALLHELFQKFSWLITLEDGTETGGFGSAVAEFAATHHYQTGLKIVGIPDEFIGQGTIEELQHYTNMDAKKLQILFDYYANC